MTVPGHEKPSFHGKRDIPLFEKKRDIFNPISCNRSFYGLLSTRQTYAKKLSVTSATELQPESKMN